MPEESTARRCTCCCRDVFPLFDLPPEAVELVLLAVRGREERRALRLVCKRSRDIVDSGIVAVMRAEADEEEEAGVELHEILALAGAPWKLQRLEVASCDVSAAHAVALAGARWAGLRELDLSNNRLHRGEAAAALAEADWPQLAKLNLRASFDDDGACGGTLAQSTEPEHLFQSLKGPGCGCPVVSGVAGSSGT